MENKPANFAELLEIVEKDPSILGEVYDGDLTSHIGINGKKEVLSEKSVGKSWEDWNNIVFSGEKNRGKQEA